MKFRILDFKYHPIIKGLYDTCLSWHLDHLTFNT